MDKYIGYCGLDCRKCEAYIATIHNDDELRAKVAKLWSELNNVEITKEMKKNNKKRRQIFYITNSSKSIINQTKSQSNSPSI